MKLALLKGTHYNPWHLAPFAGLDDRPEVVVYLSETGKMRKYHREDLTSLGFCVEPLLYEHQTGPWIKRFRSHLQHRFLKHEPRIAAFHDSLQSFDLIQSWELYTDWTAEALKARRKWSIPVCVMVWDNIPFNMERNVVRRQLKETAAKAADIFVVHTERSRRMLDVEGVEENKVIHIDPGIDTIRFGPGARARKHYGLDLNEFVILFVGWLMPRKGVEFLLLSLRELIRDSSLRKKRPVRLWVVGSGPGSDRIQEMAKRLHVEDHCTFTGLLPYDAMPAVYRSADVFVMPSIITPEWQEQCGMNILEAMACGVPVISTHSGAIPELVEDAAVLCQPNDFVSLYQALKKFIQEAAHEKEYAERGRSHVMRRFNLPRYTEAMAVVYRNILNR